jgi:hypothetical protein
MVFIICIWGGFFGFVFVGAVLTDIVEHRQFRMHYGE